VTLGDLPECPRGDPGRYPFAFVATDKRERQRAARLEKTVAQQTAVKRARTRRTGLRVLIAAVVVLGLLFGASQLMGDDDEDTATGDEASDSTPIDESEADFTNPELADEVLAREPPTPEPPPADTPADALEITTLIEGEGEGVAAGDVITAHYHGVLSDGSTFDQSWERGETISVTVGAGEVIPGWDEGLIGAKIGERRHLAIGSNKAYGAAGSPPNIPANAPLAFDIDIVDIQPGGGTSPTTAPAG
jgi:peptidylprolyl isomerase